MHAISNTLAGTCVVVVRTHSSHTWEIEEKNVEDSL